MDYIKGTVCNFWNKWHERFTNFTVTLTGIDFAYIAKILPIGKTTKALPIPLSVWGIPYHYHLSLFSFIYQWPAPKSQSLWSMWRGTYVVARISHKEKNSLQRHLASFSHSFPQGHPSSSKERNPLVKTNKAFPTSISSWWHMNGIFW